MKTRPKYYAQYCDAKTRCNNPNCKSYPHYGGRGIEFRFTSYKDFEADLGEKPDGYTLDRIDVHGHYEPGNIRWASWSVQNKNRRTHKPHACHKDSLIPYVGITWDKQRQKYLVRKKNIYIGRTNTLEEALKLSTS